VSLGIVIKGTEGLVLAAESRVTLTVTPPGQPSLYVSYDNASKLLSFKTPHNHIGAVTYGAAAIDQRTAHSLIPEFEASLPTARLGVEEFSNQLHQFFLGRWQSIVPPNYSGPPMSFVIGGFDEQDLYGRVFAVDIPYVATPQERNPHPNFGMSWGGQREFADRIIQGYDSRLRTIAEQVFGASDPRLAQFWSQLGMLQLQVPIQVMPLQDCVDLAIFIIRTTIDGQQLTAGIRGVGGPIDVATITRQEGLRFVQKKSVRGERP